MFFLIRAAFYIGVVLLLMPPPKEAPRPGAKLASTEDAAGAVAGTKRMSVGKSSADAAKAKAANGKATTAKGTGVAVGMSKVASVPSSEIAEYGSKAAGYCLRKPDVCRAGAADGIGERLSKGVRVISALIADAAASPATTGTISRVAP
jgi:hypothetical protein